jgi:hypothetical protein
MNVFRVSLVPGKDFIALCTWKYGLYDIVLNGLTYLLHLGLHYIHLT